MPPPGRMAPSKAPDKGSFPLDHHAQCKEAMKRYLDCMSIHRSTHRSCKDLSKAYLECRMKRGLMKDEPMELLGYQKEEVATTHDSNTTEDSENRENIAYAAQRKKKEHGFNAGLNVKKRTQANTFTEMFRSPRPDGR